jgi:hypothetical protein
MGTLGMETKLLDDGRVAYRITLGNDIVAAGIQRDRSEVDAVFEGWSIATDPDWPLAME